MGDLANNNEIYDIRMINGALAQLVARFNGIEEVTSSNLVRSTNYQFVDQYV